MVFSLASLLLSYFCNGVPTAATDESPKTCYLGKLSSRNGLDALAGKTASLKLYDVPEVKLIRIKDDLMHKTTLIIC